MKKSVLKKCLTATMLAAVMMVTGCGGNKQTADGITEVTMWTNYSHSKSVMTGLVDSFNKTIGKEKGIKLVYEVREGDAGKDIEIALVSGNAPDIFVGDNDANARDGKILALNDIEGGEEFLAKYVDKFPERRRYDGKFYSIPFSSTSRGLIINEDMFVKAGIVDENGKAKAPKTWDELVECAKKLTNEAEREYGIIFPMKWGTWVTSDIMSPGFSSIGFDGYNPATGEYDYTGYKPMMEAIMQIKENGSYFPGAEGLDNDPARSRFAEGKIGMKFGFSWDVAVLNDQFPANFNWTVVPYPVVDVNNSYKQLLSSNGGFVINKANAEKKDVNKIFEVYKWFHSEDVMTELYANCCELPPMEGFIKDETLKVEKRGWKEFCELVDISVTRAKAMPTETSGIETIAELFINKVWPGQMSIDDALSQYTKDMNEGITRYFEINTDDNREKYIIPDYNVKR